jgi:hypothetical protein
VKTTAIAFGLCICALAAGCADTYRRSQGDQPRVAANYLQHLDEEGSPEWRADNPQRAFRSCRVDTVDCMDLDERPFRACLLDSEHCPSDAERILLHLD